MISYFAFEQWNLKKIKNICYSRSVHEGGASVSQFFGLNYLAHYMENNTKRTTKNVK